MQKREKKYKLSIDEALFLVLLAKFDQGLSRLQTVSNQNTHKRGGEIFVNIEGLKVFLSAV
jgi:hypothetical protein